MYNCIALPNRIDELQIMYQGNRCLEIKVNEIGALVSQSHFITLSMQLQILIYS